MSRRIFCRVLLVAVAFFGLLVLSNILSAQGSRDTAFERVKEVQAKHTARLMKIKDVVGTAIGLDGKNQPELKVLTARRGVAGIAKKLDGVAVQTVVTGKFVALKGPPEGKGRKKKVDPTARFDRPVPIGVSTGNEGECSAGTIGCRVTDGTKVYALSNNHVYALENTAQVGSEVLQPGRYDTKPRCTVSSGDVIGTLSDFEPIVFNDANNTIDAAIALTLTADVNNATPSNGYGIPKSVTVDAVVEQAVQKYGRASSLTKGTINMVSATVDVGYSSGTARFVDQIIVYGTRGPFTKPGDSGSLVVTDPDKNPVGLLFAGNRSGKYAIANPIDPVLTRFNVAIDGE